jgi:hypothetical protein
VPQTRGLRELAAQYGLLHRGGVWIASEPEEGYVHRRWGYRDGGRLLLANAAESRAKHELIWPALAVYRHFFELQLKETVRIGWQVLEEPESKTFGHGLPKLLDQVVKAMLVVWPEDADEQAQPIKDAVDFLHGMDPTAQVLRYARLAKTGEPSVPESAMLDPAGLLDLLEHGAGLLIGTEDGMSHWVEQRNEYLSEMHDYYGSDY